MKTSTEIGSAAKIIGEEKAVEYLAKAGFLVYTYAFLTETCSVVRLPHLQKRQISTQ